MCTHETLPRVLAFPQTRWHVSPAVAAAVAASSHNIVRWHWRLVLFLQLG